MSLKENEIKDNIPVLMIVKGQNLDNNNFLNYGPNNNNFGGFINDYRNAQNEQSTYFINTFSFPNDLEQNYYFVPNGF